MAKDKGKFPFHKPRISIICTEQELVAVRRIKNAKADGHMLSFSDFFLQLLAVRTAKEKK